MLINLPQEGSEPANRYAILSFDGGGYRGGASLYIADVLEKALEKSLGIAFTRMGGTSIGSLNAMFLCYANEEGQPKWSVAAMIPKFEDTMYKVFARTWGQILWTGGGLWAPQFNHTHLDNIASDYFGETPLNRALLPLSIPAVNFHKESTEIFRSSRAHDSLKMVDVLKASTAAPTYFKSYSFEYKGETNTYVDGGLAANNPTEIAFRDLLTEDRPKPQDKVIVVSIGTGTTPTDNPLIKTGWGLLQWAPDIIDTFMTSNASLTDQGMQQLIPGKPGSGANWVYARAQIILNKDHENIADPSPANFAYLHDRVSVFFEDNPNFIRNIAKEFGISA